jgi:RNA polymerase sigma-70 factor (ECF subfamily)
MEKSDRLQHEVTRLLQEWRSGDDKALEKLTPLVDGELRRLAHNYMRNQREGHTLQTTALVNEAFLRLVQKPQIDWKGRAHFIAVAATAMRHVIIDYARQRQSGKRGGAMTRVTLSQGLMKAGGREPNVLQLDEALRALAEVHPRPSRVIELRYFGGLNNKEMAEVMGVSEGTIERDWRFARAWLFRELSGIAE